MHTSNYQGDVIIKPSQSGLTFAIQPELQLTLAKEKSQKNPWRWLLPAAISMLVISLPNFSFAATYTGDDIVRATNAARTEHGLSALTVNPALGQAALAK